MITRFLIGLLVIFLLTGCQTLSERKQADALQEVLRTYGGVVRWGSFDQLRRFVRPDRAGEPVADTSGQIRVTHYEVVQGPALVDGNKAIQTALIQYVFVDSQVVKEVVDQQTWEYDAEQESWYLISPLPSLK
ncbi:MAG: asparagine synthetase [Candidatus Thiodiazotropha sp.]